MLNTRSLFFLVVFISGLAFSEDFILTGANGEIGDRAQSNSCTLYGESVFTSDASNTVYTAEQSYSGNKAIKMTIDTGARGFGSFGGIISFENCFPEKVQLVKGDEVWVRLRIFLPQGFEYNLNGRNKFLRFRTYHNDGATPVSEGYNDLYIDGNGDTPFDYIFEGEQRWAPFGDESHQLTQGKWETIEYYLRLDDKKASEGGEALVRFWLNGELVGETNERKTLKTADSYINSLYVFTYWDNEGAHKTQSLYIDDFYLTYNTPLTVDKLGNRMVGLGEGSTRSAPSGPSSVFKDVIKATQ